MRLDDFRADVPAELASLAKEWQVTRCYVFTAEEWEKVLELRRTEWKSRWGMQW